MTKTPSVQELPDESDAPFRRLELRIAVLLRAGVLLSAFVMALGWLWGWVRVTALNPAQQGAFKALQTYTRRPLSTSLEAHWVSGNWPALLCYLGLFLLVALPAVRVLLTAVLFALQRDRILSVLAAAVFLALVASFFLGLEI